MAPSLAFVTNITILQYMIIHTTSFADCSDICAVYLDMAVAITLETLHFKVEVRLAVATGCHVAYLFALAALTR